MIKLVIFDAEHVLYSAEEQMKYFSMKLTEFVKKNSKTDPQELGSIWKEFGEAVMVGKITMLQAHKEYISRIGIRPELIGEYEAFDRESFNYAKLMEKDEGKYLKDLKMKGYKLAVLSDSGHPASIRELIMGIIGLGGIFDRAFVSCEIGHKNPPILLC